MSTPVQLYLTRLAASFSSGAPEGDGRLGVALTLADGHQYEAGATDQVPLSSLAAPLVYALALEDLGLPRVLERIGTVPTPDHRHLLDVEPETGRALNPLHDAGVVAATALVKGRGGRDRAARLLQLASSLLDREVSVTDTATRAEEKTLDRPRAAAWLMKSLDAFDADPTAVLSDLARLRAVTVSVQEVATIATVFALGGVHPHTGDRVFSDSTARAVTSILASCGLTTRDPLWAMNVGQPGWASASGGVTMLVVPGHLGLALRSDELDENGMSVRGMSALRTLVEEFELHASDVVSSPLSALRSHYRVDQAPSGTSRTAETLHALEAHGEHAHLLELGGHIGFSQVEALVHVIADLPETLETLVFDIRSVHSISAPARRLIGQWIGHAIASGVDVVLADRTETLLDELVATADESVEVNLPPVHRESEADPATYDPTTAAPQFVFFASRSQAMQWCEQRLLARHAPHLFPQDAQEALHSPLMQHLGEDDAALLESMMETRRFHDGQVIRRAGQPFGGIYVITRGEVVLTGQSTGGRRTRRTVLSPGMTFGEMALGQPGRQPSTVRARGEVTTRVLTAQVMYALQEASPQLAMRLWESLARDAYTALAQLVRETGALQD